MRVETVIHPQAAGDLQSIAAAARRTEALGFDGLTTSEGGHDPFLPLVLAAEHTKLVRLGTNVAIAFPRSPMVTAQLAWDLQHLSRGRFALGLGTQGRAHIERRFAAEWKDPPGPRLRDYVLCLRAMWEAFQSGGKPRRFESEHYRFDLLPAFSNPGPIEHPHVPIYLGAVNPFAARLAGELGEGVRLHPIATFRYAREVIVPAIEAGAARGGRTRAAIDLVAEPFLAIAPDRDSLEAAKRALKRQIAFYAAVPEYRRVLAHHQWESLGEDLARLAAERRSPEMENLISEAMLDEWAIVATWDELAERVVEKCGSLFDTVLLDLSPDFVADETRVWALVDALH